jgi:hypothetical protein
MLKSFKSKIWGSKKEQLSDFVTI